MPDTPVSALAAARRMCVRSEWTLTNLELQKMLYLAQMMHLGKTGERLLNGRFEAWDFGPVIPAVYHQVKAYGKDAIKGGLLAFGPVRDDERAKMLDDAYDSLSKLTPGRLVAITHWEGGAWAKNYIPGVRGIPIPDADMIDEYRKRFPS